MPGSPKDRLSSRRSGIATSVAVYGDISNADRMVLRGPTRGVDVLAVYLTAGHVVAAVCVGQTAPTERLVERAVAEGAIPVANIADSSVALDDAFFSPPVAQAA